MYKLLALVILFSMSIAVSFAASPSERVSGDGSFIMMNGSGWYESITATKVALTSATDTATLLYRWMPKQVGTDIVFTRGKLRNSIGDSVKCRVIVDCLSETYGLMYSVDIDTITDSLGEAIKLPIGSTCVGAYFNLRLQAMTGHAITRADSLPTIMRVYYPQLKVTSRN